VVFVEVKGGTKMSHIKSYQLVEEISSGGLFLAVNQLLSEGWELHGPTQIIATDFMNVHNEKEFQTTYYQAMVLLKPPIQEPQPG
jgi:hypothetical protein